MKSTTVQLLKLETRRLYSLGVKFRMYENSDNGRVGIVVRDVDNDSDNKERIRKAGYKPAGSAKKDKSQLYEIPANKLERIHNDILQLLAQEYNRLRMNGIEFYSSEVLDSGNLVISIVDFQEIALRLTELGYTYFDGLPTSKSIGNYVISIDSLKELYAVSYS